MPTIKPAATFPLSSLRTTGEPMRSATGTDLEQANTLLRRGSASTGCPPLGLYDGTVGVEHWIDDQEPNQSPVDGRVSEMRHQEPEEAIELNTMATADTGSATPELHPNEAMSDSAALQSANVYTPICCPEGFAKLDFRPVMLKKGVTIGLAAFYLVIIAGIVALTYCGDSSSNYAVINPNIYFGARFGPSIVGTVTTVLVRSFLQDLCRMLPYVNMADPKPGVWGCSRASNSVAALYYPTLGTYTRAGWAILLLQAVTAPLIALKLGLIEVLDSSEGWMVIVHPLVSHILIAYYVIQILVLGFVTVWLWDRETGLRSDWDPTSLADIIALFQHFNVDSEFFSVPADMPARLQLLQSFRFRLGYWRLDSTKGSDEPTQPYHEVVYGIRHFRQGSLESPSDFATRRSRRAVKEHKTEMYFPYRSLPVLSFGWQYTLSYCVLGTCLLIAMVITASLGMTDRIFTIGTHGDFAKANSSLEISDVSDRNMTTSRTGFFWLRGPTDEVHRLLLWNFLLRMLPTTIANLVILRSIVFDKFHLYAQPLVEMYNGPTPAEKTILLDYLTLSPLAVSLQAWSYCHWKVLYFAILNILAPVSQLIPGGILLLTSKEDVIYGSFSRAFVVSAIGVLAIYLGSYLFAYLSIKRRFPRWGTSLIDIWAMCFSSNLARYPEFSECGPGWTKKDLAASLQLRYDKFSLGLCTGVDGEARVGFDTACIGREQKPTYAVWYVYKEKPLAVAHCYSCSIDPESHGRADALKQSQMLIRHYRDHVPPIECERAPQTPE